MASKRPFAGKLTGAIGALSLAIGALFGAPALAQATDQPAPEVPPSVGSISAQATAWQLPDGVQRVGQTLFHVDDDGEVTGTGAVAPGRTFFYAFQLENTGSEPVTVIGFEPNFVFEMHPDRQGDLPDDHCLQFIETRDFEDRQTYPQAIEPGETLAFADNETYHYIHDRENPSNECQQASFFFGPPVFETLESVTAVQPEWREASCDASAAVVIPEVEGVRYALDGEHAAGGAHDVAADAEATVTASAVDGFQLPEDGTIEWSHAFTAPDCADGGGRNPGNGADGGDGDPGNGADDSGDASGSDENTGPAVTTAGGAGSTALAATGGSDSPFLWMAALGAIALGGALLLGARLWKRGGRGQR